MVNANSLLILGITVVIIGFILIFIATALQSSSKTGEVKSGGVILIGPIPIIFGSDKGLIFTAVILAIVLMVTAYLLFYRTMG
jgi:uncharacterized protein (TIGR00304 family)